MSRSQPHTSVPRTVKEGILLKRGEHIKNWRTRYFVLREDGAFLGFRQKPDSPSAPPLNDFNVEECEILASEQPRPNTFVLRCRHANAEVERVFSVELEEERHSWMRAIAAVRQRRREEPGSPAARGADDDDEGAGAAAEAVTGAGEDGRDRRPRAKKGIDDFELLKVLGKGGYGKVFLCRERPSGGLFAVKVLKKSVVIEKNVEAKTIAEKEVLQRTRHPFILHLKCSFSTDDRLFLVTEYASGGDLYFHLKMQYPFPEERAKFYAAQITCAITYLHHQGIVHRDFKLENLLLCADGYIKVADFGVCKQEMTYGARTATRCGTEHYMAPEILSRPNYGRAVDWWSLGAVLYEMMVGLPPFYDTCSLAIRRNILTMKVRFPPCVSTDACNLIDRLLDKNPASRLGGGSSDGAEVMGHEFFQGINWRDLESKKVEPPYKPQLTSETDTSFFDPEFTEEPANLSPPPSPAPPPPSRQKDDDDFDAVWGDLVSLAESVFSQFSYLGSSCSSGSRFSDGTTSSATVECKA